MDSPFIPFELDGQPMLCLDFVQWTTQELHSIRTMAGGWGVMDARPAEHRVEFVVRLNSANDLNLSADEHEVKISRGATEIALFRMLFTAVSFDSSVNGIEARVEGIVLNQGEATDLGGLLVREDPNPKPDLRLGGLSEWDE